MRSPLISPASAISTRTQSKTAAWTSWGRRVRLRDSQTRSSVRVRVEHVFGAQSNDMGGTLVRSVGLVRAKARIELKNLAYNMRRLVQLERLAAAV